MNTIKYDCELTLPLMEKTINKIMNIMNKKNTPYIIVYKYKTLLINKMDEANIFIKQMKVKEDKNKFINIVEEFNQIAIKTIQNI
jgi:nitrogen regulatory protein PII-like uncharacterized protein